jgi:hypothetical protein
VNQAEIEAVFRLLDLDTLEKRAKFSALAKTDEVTAPQATWNVALVDNTEQNTNAELA